MALYAYLPYEEGNNIQHYTGELFEYEDNVVWLFESTKMTVEEREYLKKQDSGVFKCFACEENMIFVTGTGGKNNFFRHSPNKKDCALPESLEHAITKLKIHNLFKEAGYVPTLERVFKSPHVDYQTRADVFVEEKTGNERIVVEIQGNRNIKPSTIARRTMAYAAENIPTAWIIILDSYFRGVQYTGPFIMDIVEFEGGTSSNVARPLRYDESHVFSSEILPNTFTQLMDAYGYIVAVNFEGYFFLIRKDFAGTGDSGAYSISRIPHDKVVDVLLATDLVTMEYHYRPRRQAESEKGEFQGTDGFFHGNREGETIEHSGINFEAAQLIERERLEDENPLDPLLLIQKTKKAKALQERAWKKKSSSVQREKESQQEKKNTDEAYVDWDAAIKKQMRIREQIEREHSRSVDRK